MTDALIVLMGDEIVGMVERSRSGTLSFRYADRYRSGDGSTPLSISMPLAVRNHPHAVVNPWLWNLLPESDAVLTRWARRFEVPASSPFGLLGTPVGLDCAGAVRFCAPERLEATLGRRGRVRWLSDDDVAGRLRALRGDATAWLGPDFAGRFSLAGMQAKVALVHDGRRWGMPEGREATSHILKPAIAGLDGHDANEHLCLRAAERVGLSTVRSEIVEIGGERAVSVRRYDRVGRGAQLNRVHQEDLCQALGLPPTAKYESDGGPNASTVVALVRRVMPARVAAAAIDQFVDALVWNWLVAGTDAHAKNYSLLLSGHEVRLAPLYDLASALPYGDHERRLRMAMKVTGDYRLHARSATDWARWAAELRLDGDRLVERVTTMIDAAPEAFVEAAAADRLDDAVSTRLLAAVDERAARLAKLMK
ncbi:MAG: type II toxin-antitoxin system HipA family toxin [Acidimicrobiia bacterium]